MPKRYTLRQKLKQLEHLKNPVIEEEDENGWVVNHYYWNENLDELCVGITYYEWDGTYTEERNPVIDMTFKRKNWKERFHSGTASKPMTLEQVRNIVGLLLKEGKKIKDYKNEKGNETDIN